MFTLSLQRLFSVAKKEFLHILRDRPTLLLLFLSPLLQMSLLGYAINTNVRDIRTAVLDQSGTQESRALLQRFENSGSFKFTYQTHSEADLTQALVSGKARVGIQIPEDYSRRLLAGDKAEVLVLVDGSDSSVGGEAINVSSNLALNESLDRILGNQQLPVELRPRVLFNPNMRSANHFIPGLMVILCQFISTLLAATAIVREKENGTMEQFFMTPVKTPELILGKILPYALLMSAAFCMLALTMRIIFLVPIQGHFATLLVLYLPFMLSMLAVGLWISTRASTRDAATQAAMMTIMPSMFLSGYIWPLDSMPLFFQYVGRAIPATWMIDASRGVILRGAGLSELWPNALILWGMAGMVLVVSSLRFRKSL